MSTTFAVGRIQDVKDLMPLVREHWNEVVRDGRELDPHWAIFDKYEEIGALRVYLAKDGSEIVGYAVFLLQPHFHSQKVLCAHNDAVFLRKDKRAGMLGARLLKHCDEQLRAEGVHGVYWHVKPWVDFGPILERMGYDHAETIYAKFN